jgi:disulfide bond formation protein DsbB
MKTNRIIYFLLIIAGAIIMATRDLWVQKEYAMSIGIILLMFGIYKSSKVWTKTDGKNREK